MFKFLRFAWAIWFLTLFIIIFIILYIPFRILLSKKDRKIWIAPGYGVEERLTAGINGELTRNIIIPEFKAGSYYSGLDKGADAIFKVLQGKYKGSRKKESNIQFYVTGIIGFMSY